MLYMVYEKTYATSSFIEDCICSFMILLGHNLSLTILQKLCSDYTRLYVTNIISWEMRVLFAACHVYNTVIDYSVLSLFKPLHFSSYSSLGLCIISSNNFYNPFHHNIFWNILIYIFLERKGKWVEVPEKQTRRNWDRKYSVEITAVPFPLYWLPVRGQCFAHSSEPMNSLWSTLLNSN